MGIAKTSRETRTLCKNGATPVPEHRNKGYDKQCAKKEFPIEQGSVPKRPFFIPPL
jgi:hypothetical protein